MATRGVGITAAAGVELVNNNVVGFASGGTLQGTNIVELDWDDTVFVGQEGKQRLLAAIEQIEARIAMTTVWPVTSAS